MKVIEHYHASVRVKVHVRTSTMYQVAIMNDHEYVQQDLKPYGFVCESSIVK